MRALADNPLVMLHHEVAELIIGGAVGMLRKAGTAGVQDAALSRKLEELGWWCTCFLRGLVGKPSPRDAAAMANMGGALPLVAQRDACTRLLLQLCILYIVEVFLD